MNDPVLEKIGLTRDKVINYFGRAPKTPPPNPSYGSRQNSVGTSDTGAVDMTRQVLRMRAQGKTTVQIARDLYLRQSTVESIITKSKILQ